MNAIDQWEQEEAALQMEILRKENEAFASLPAEERARIIKEGRDRLEAFAEVAESDEDDEESSDD